MASSKCIPICPLQNTTSTGSSILRVRFSLSYVKFRPTFSCSQIPIVWRNCPSFYVDQTATKPTPHLLFFFNFKSYTNFMSCLLCLLHKFLHIFGNTPYTACIFIDGYLHNTIFWCISVDLFQRSNFFVQCNRKSTLSHNNHVIYKRTQSKSIKSSESLKLTYVLF